MTISPEAITMAIKEFHLPAMQSILGKGFDLVLRDGKEWQGYSFGDEMVPAIPVGWRWQFRCVYAEELEYGSISFSLVTLEHVTNVKFLKILEYETDKLIHDWVRHRMEKVRKGYRHERVT